MMMSLRLFDARNVLIEELLGTEQEMAEEARQFIILHCADPDEDGRGAQAGRIEIIPHPNLLEQQ